MSDESKVEMGTTCVCALIKKKEAFIANVCDSRAYLINNNQINQISIDHTYVQMLFEEGKINKDEIKTHHQRNVITRAVGIEEKIEPDYFEIEISNETVVFLCTDGLSNYCSEEIINDIISNNDLEEASLKLIEYANNQGGKDNITIALVANN